MSSHPLNITPLAVDATRAALLAQFRDPLLRRRATMLWGTRGVGKSSLVHQVAQEAGVPLIDLRLTTIEPVDLRGALYADEVAGRTVWLPPEFLPGSDTPAGILFLDELTAADQRLQISAYSLILDRRVGNYHLPEGWMIVAAGNAAFHGAVSHDMGTALADRLFHFHVQSTLPAFIDYALAGGFAPQVMAFLQVRPDRLDDTADQLAQDFLVGASPRGWEDVSAVLQSSMSAAQQRQFVHGRIGSANAAEFFAVLADLDAGASISALLDAQPGPETAALLPGSLDALYGLVYALVAAATDRRTLHRAFEIVEQFADLAGHLPAREATTLCMELLLQQAIIRGLEADVIDSTAYQRYSATREPA